MFYDYIILSMKSIAARRVRSWLTLIGIIVGITAVVSLISLGQGMQNSINEQFKSLGSNRITVAPGGSFLGPGTADLVTAVLDEKDLNIIRSIKGVEDAQGVLVRSLRAEFNDHSEFVSIFAFDTTPRARTFVEHIGLFD